MNKQENIQYVPEIFEKLKNFKGRKIKEKRFDQTIHDYHLNFLVFFGNKDLLDDGEVKDLQDGAT